MRLPPTLLCALALAASSPTRAHEPQLSMLTVRSVQRLVDRTALEAEYLRFMQAKLGPTEPGVCLDSAGHPVKCIMFSQTAGQLPTCAEHFRLVAHFGGSTYSFPNDRLYFDVERPRVVPEQLIVANDGRGVRWEAIASGSCMAENIRLQSNVITDPWTGPTSEHVDLYLVSDGVQRDRVLRVEFTLTPLAPDP